MKKFVLIIFLLPVFSYAQKNYEKYYYFLTKAYQTTDTVEENKFTKKAFAAIRLTPNGLFSEAYNAYTNKDNRRGAKLIIKAAKYGYGPNDIENWPFIDSIVSKDKTLSQKIDKKYKCFIKFKCDVINSIAITKLFDADRHIRMYLSDFSHTDTNYIRFRGNEMVKTDSVNYFSLIEILKSPKFDPSKLTEEAKLGIGLILTHSATNPYANPDTVFTLLKKEIKMGILNMQFYANSYDRYYIYTFGMNYYCSFYRKDLPIFDIQNIDKRRNEVFLYSLYTKFKLNGELDKLPKDYQINRDRVSQ